MLRTNLATRPFAQERLVRIAFGALVGSVLAFSLFNTVRLTSLLASQARLGSQAEDTEREAEGLIEKAQRTRNEIDPEQLAEVSEAAREANGIIDRRVFSWTQLFGVFEETLPEGVRIRSVQPRLDRGTFTVVVAAEAREVEDVDAFVEALEATGAFHDVLTVEESTDDDGILQAAVEGIYTPPARDDPEAGAGG